MLKVRVIPTLLEKQVGLVKGKGFDSWRRVGTVLPAVKVYNTREVDELIWVDIAATNEGHDLDYDLIQTIASECFVPLTVGGGLHSVEQIAQLLRSGADKICLNSAVFEKPALVEAAANRFGSQCVVASVDVRRHPDGQLECFSHSGKQAQGIDPVQWCQKLEALGAGEILLTSIERDGTMTGYDLAMIQAVRDKISIPIIASGGCGRYEHMYEAVKAGADAVAAAAMFHYTEHTPLGAKRYLQEQGVPVRQTGLSAS